MSTNKLALKKAAAAGVAAPLLFLGGLLWMLSLTGMIITAMSILAHLLGASGYEEINWGFAIPLGLGSMLAFSLITAVATYLTHRVNE